jgi:RNA polymerase primary sigma factor
MSDKGVMVPVSERRGPDVPVAADPVQALLMQAARFPLLSASQEVALARRYRDHCDLEAKDRMINSNLRLVVKLARQYEGLSTLTVGDLVGEGIVGLIRAVEKFDPERGFKFSTYAVNWIRQSMQRAMFDRGTEIRVPSHVAQQQFKVHKRRTALQTRLGREPTSEELADDTGLSVQRIVELGGLARVATSLDAPREEDQLPLVGALASSAPSPEREVCESDWAAKVRALVATLPPSEARAVRLAFELDAAPQPDAPGDSGARGRRPVQSEALKRGLARLARDAQAAELRAAA